MSAIPLTACCHSERADLPARIVQTKDRYLVRLSLNEGNFRKAGTLEIQSTQTVLFFNKPCVIFQFLKDGGWPRLTYEKGRWVALLAGFANVGSFDPADTSECP